MLWVINIPVFRVSWFLIFFFCVKCVLNSMYIPVFSVFWVPLPYIPVFRVVTGSLYIPVFSVFWVHRRYIFLCLVWSTVQGAVNIPVLMCSESATNPMILSNIMSDLSTPVSPRSIACIFITFSCVPTTETILSFHFISG